MSENAWSTIVFFSVLMTSGILMFAIYSVVDAFNTQARAMRREKLVSSALTVVAITAHAGANSEAASKAQEWYQQTLSRLEV